MEGIEIVFREIGLGDYEADQLRVRHKCLE